MSKIKHWNEASQQWEIDGASNAANIELTNPGYLDENGDSISVDQGFTKVNNRISKMEKNLAWIYQNGAKGGGGGGSGGGTIDSTEYNIVVEEGNRVYTASTSVTIHITITGGSLKKLFQVEITNAQTGERLTSPSVTGLTRTEIVINGLGDATQTLKISAHTGLYYASDYILTVIAGAIKIRRPDISAPQTQIYPDTQVSAPIINATNSTDSDLLLVVEYSTDEINYTRYLEKTIENTGAASYEVRLSEVANFLHEEAQTHLGETYSFNVYAQGVLNDNILQSNIINFKCTIVAINTLYILTYGVNRAVPQGIGDLLDLNQFVYGQSVQFYYELYYSDNRYPIYNIDFEITPCYFEEGVLVSRSDQGITGQMSRVNKGERTVFSFSTASLPLDTIFDPETDSYKFIKVSMHAYSVDDNQITDDKVLYFTLSRAVEKYITATNFDRSLICYFSPVLGVPTGNTMTWTYDNQNTQFPYSTQGIVQQRYVSLIAHNSNGIRNDFTTQGLHLTGKGYAVLDLNLFSAQANEVNLIGTSGFTISTTFRTNANIDSNDTVLSLGKYIDGEFVAGIEILAEKIRVAVNRQYKELNITKGDLTTVDIVFEKYVGLGDDDTTPNHWFLKIFLNGTLSSLSSWTHSQFTDVSLGTAWYFDDNLCLGARLQNGEVVSSAEVHFYDLKIYSSALSDNEITQNCVSAVIHSELDNGESPSQTLQTELLAKNFIQMGTNGEYESLLFDTNNPREYKDPDTLLSTLRAALADSKIPYPIVVINQLTPNSDFFGITQAQFPENQREQVTGENYRYPISMDYYTMGSTSAIHISNEDRMKISIQGTSSLQFVSKNYEIYMGKDDTGEKDVLVQMKEDWLPENEFTLKADVMDSAHVNNILIGKIINGMVTTTDSGGNTVAIKPLDNTPPMNINNPWASKIKHTSEGYPVILFINFKNTDGSTICKCQGIYNFNLGRAASFNLGLKLLTSCTFVDNAVSFPRMVDTYEQTAVISNNAPVYSVEVGENNQLIGAFDQGSSDIINSGIFDTIYSSDGFANSNLLTLLNFLASFGANVSNPKKVQVQGEWCTPIVVKDGNSWTESGAYYYPMNASDYKQNVLEMHMNWNNLVAYYIIAIVFGLVDSMGKNLTLRTWNRTMDENGVPQCVWYMCFYDMDTAMRLDNDGNESVPYNAHLNRYYTDHSGVYSETRVQTHASSIAGIFTQSYSSPNTRLQEIAENLVPEADAKTLSSVYIYLRTTLFPDPGAFIDTYYTGQINQIGAALYNYDYNLKYLQTKNQYDLQTRELILTKEYNQLSYLHGNGATNIKNWFRKRVRFLDGIYGVTQDGSNSISQVGLTDLTLASSWTDNNATYTQGKDGPIITLGLQSESQTLINIAAGDSAKINLWVNETKQNYKIRNVTGQMRYAFFGNDVLIQLDGFENFHWVSLGSINFPRIKKLSLRNQTEVSSSSFLVNQMTTYLQSLVELDMSGFSLMDSSSQIVYTGLNFVANLPSLEILDISRSSFNAVSLPASGVLRTLNLSETKITSLKFNGQPMLENMLIEGCTSLEEIELKNCPKLRTLTVPQSVRRIVLENCIGIESIYCTYSTDKTLSPLTYISISSCDGLKTIDLSGQNNPNLSINLQGAYNLETVILYKLVTTDIIFPSKITWKTLKYLNIAQTTISTLNYQGEISTYLDLEHFTQLNSIEATNNYSITEIHCPNIEDHYIELDSTAFYGCSGLTTLIGNFKLIGNRVFHNCSSLVLNAPNKYTSIDYTSTYIPGNFCNITFHDSLSTYSEMFSGCSSLSGQDFRYIMDKVKESVTNLSKMFMGCSQITVDLWKDIFSKCPHVINLTSFCEGAGVSGSFFSTKGSDKGILAYLPDLQSASYAFANTRLQWIDNNAFLGCSSLKEADQMFANCWNLYSCEDTHNPTYGGYLHSKTFFTNLSGLDKVFPDRVFMGCTHVDMLIDSEDLGNGVIFDYLFHYDMNRTYESTQLDDSVYTGVNLIGEIHANVFGGIQHNDGQYAIPEYNIISTPFIHSGSGITAKLNQLGDMFSNLDPISLIGVLQGIQFEQGETNHIPDNIFQGCSNLLKLSKFFANPTINNNGEIYEFPNQTLFRDCTKLNDVSLLFNGAKYLNIKLLSGGFLNNPIENFEGMLSNSGVFGMIPYKFMRTSGRTIKSMSGVFSGCYKLGYTADRTIDEGTLYYKNENPYRTTWDDAVISNPGTPVYFQIQGVREEELQIDGTPLSSSSPAYDAEVNEYDLQQQQILECTTGSVPGYYQNYMFPADLFYSCASSNTLNGALRGLSYTTNVLETTDLGITHIVSGPIDGVKGRIPMKLFKNLPDITELGGVFSSLEFCPFVGFKNYLYYNNSESALNSRGIKLPPDLFRYSPNIETLNGTFSGITVERGIDLNLNLSTLTNLRNITQMLSNIQFYDGPIADMDLTRTQDPTTYYQGNFVAYKQVDTNTFANNHQLRILQGLFSVSSNMSYSRGLLHVESELFRPEDQNGHPYISDVSSMFYNNHLLSGQIPLMNGAYIQYYSGYIEGVNKNSITNAQAFISTHPDWLPSSWREE